MKKLKRRILITAGPTQERIDPVRYISNRSSGKMGYALARAASAAGHSVTLISGPVCLSKPAHVKTLHVVSAKEMLESVLTLFPKHDVVIMVAAVADYRVAVPKKIKIKKSATSLHLKLIKNPDILAILGKTKAPHQTLVGFAAETHNVKKYALEKLRKKNLDWIICNDVSKMGIGFESDENEVTLFGKNGEIIPIKKTHKLKLSRLILNQILSQ